MTTWTPALQHYQTARKGLDELATGESGRTPIHPQYVARMLDEVAAPDAIFSCDVGTPTIWAARYLKMNGQRRLLGSFSHGSMANALPQAIGAQVSHPTGKYNPLGRRRDCHAAGRSADAAPAPFAVVFNRLVELEMKAAGILEFATELVNPDFAKMAEAAGILGLKAETPEQVRLMLVEALRHDGPALVEVVVNRQELAMPPTIKLDQMMGFSLYLIKAVLDGRGTKVIDLAKTNLFR